MKIRTVDLFPIVTPRETGIANQHIIVKLASDEGAVGYGEMSDLSHFPRYLVDVPDLERGLREILVGRNPFDLAAIEEVLLRFFPDENHMYSTSGMIRCGIDVALHDLLGHILGQPVYNLLGGRVRDRVRVCYPIFRHRSLAEVEPNLERVAQRLAQGFDLIRLYVGANLEADELFLRRLRERFERRVSVKSLDFSNLLAWRDAVAAVRRLTPFGVMLVESPCPRSDLDGLAEVRRRVDVPVSEHVYNLAHGYLLLKKGAVDIFNIAPYLVGGLRPALRLFALAEAAGAQCLIGTTQELNLGTAASAHLGTAVRNLDFPCDPTGPHLYLADVVREPLRYADGYVHAPSGPGLGPIVDEEKLASLSGVAAWTMGSSIAGVVDRTPAREQGHAEEGDEK